MAPRGKAPPRPPSGHVFRVERERGPQWYAKYRLPDGRQVQKKIGPAWTERGRRRPATSPSAWPRTGCATFSTKRGAERCPGMVKTGATFADAADEWLRYVEHDRGRKPSTVAGYRSLLRSQLLPTFGELPIESITTPMIEGWSRASTARPRTRTKALVADARHLQAGAQALRAAAQSGGGRREAADRAERRHRGLLAGGGHGAGPRGCVRAGRARSS